MSGEREIWLIRHAESAWNALGRWQGQADPSLSPRGREQAEELATRLAADRFDALVTSDLARARETADALARATGLVPRLDPRLRERDLGAWAGLTHAEIRARWPAEYARVQERDLAIRPGGGESLRDVAQRSRAFFRDLAGEPPVARVAVVAHGGVIRALCGVPPIPNVHVLRTTLAALLAE